MPLKKTVVALSLAAAALSANAAGLYLSAGLPGPIVGVSHALSDSFALRADFSRFGPREDDRSEGGIDYLGRVKLQRAGVFADWFVFSGALRLTAGVTANTFDIDLAATSRGGTIQIGGQTYNYGPGDRFDAQVRFDKSTPYLGLGWGHHGEKGWGFVWDIGASIGKATVTATTSGPNLSQVSRSDIDRELQDLRDTVGKVRAMPQLSLGLSYKF